VPEVSVDVRVEAGNVTIADDLHVADEAARPAADVEHPRVERNPCAGYGDHRLVRAEELTGEPADTAPTPGGVSRPALLDGVYDYHEDLEDRYVARYVHKTEGVIVTVMFEVQESTQGRYVFVATAFRPRGKPRKGER